MELRKVNVMIWAKYFVPAPICPYVRTGIGISKINFNEKYNPIYFENISVNDKILTLGIGGGLEIFIFKKLLLSIFVDALLNPQDLPVDHHDGTPWSTLHLGVTPMSGLRVALKL